MVFLRGLGREQEVNCWLLLGVWCPSFPVKESPKGTHGKALYLRNYEYSICKSICMYGPFLLVPPSDKP